MVMLKHPESNNMEKGQKKIDPRDPKRYAMHDMRDKLNPFTRSSPLFSPEDPEFGFSAGSGGPSRRKFLKRTGGATLASFLAAIPSRMEAQRTSASGSGDYVRTTTQWRLKCINAPNPNDGNIVWMEVPTLGAQGKIGFAKLDCSGPQPNDIGYQLTPVRGQLTSSVGDGGMEASQARLEYPNGADYLGAEIVDNADQPRPSLKYRHFGDGATSPFLTLAVVEQKATATIAYSGYIFDSMTVSAGNTVNNKKEYTNGGGNTYNSKQSAVTGLEGNYNGQAGASTDFVGTNHKWSVQAERRATHSGELNKNEKYARTVASDGTVTWQATGEIKSSISGSMESEWTIVTQTKRKAYHYVDGVLVKTVVTKDWDDPDPQKEAQ